MKEFAQGHRTITQQHQVLISDLAHTKVLNLLKS